MVPLSDHIQLRFTTNAYHTATFYRVWYTYWTLLNICKPLPIFRLPSLAWDSALIERKQETHETLEVLLLQWQLRGREGTMNGLRRWYSTSVLQQTFTDHTRTLMQHQVSKIRWRETFWFWRPVFLGTFRISELEGKQNWIRSNNMEFPETQYVAPV